MTALSPPRLGELFHIGWVVRDCEAAQEELRTRLGAGPCLSMGEESLFDQVLVHGKPVPVSLKIVYCALGGVVVELLQPLDDRSPHAAFLAERGEGMHHLAFVVTDFDEQLAAARRDNPERTLLIDGTGTEADPMAGARVTLIGSMRQTTRPVRSVPGCRERRCRFATKAWRCRR